MPINKADRILFIAGKTSPCYIAADFLTQRFAEVIAVHWAPGDPYPVEIDQWLGEWIISFKSDLIIPTKTLSKASKGAINFHPAPPCYRGVGGSTYSIYNNDKRFGVTSHFMIDKIDYGKIIKVLYFDILPGETASSLNERTGEYALILFYEIIQLISLNKALPYSTERWSKKLYTRKELKKS